MMSSLTPVDQDQKHGAGYLIEGKLEHSVFYNEGEGGEFLFSCHSFLVLAGKLVAYGKRCDILAPISHTPTKQALQVQHIEVRTTTGEVVI
eukprot:755107-Hanusia_phi.AAC.4